MLFFQALLLFISFDLFISCQALLIHRDPKLDTARNLSLNTTNVGTSYTYTVPGTSTKVLFQTLRDRFMINSLDTTMCLGTGLHVMTKSIAARGGKAYVSDDELDFEWSSADLQMKHSDQGPGAMKLSVFADLLFAILEALFMQGLHLEIKIDVWDGRLHVGTGWLLNLDHPPGRPGGLQISS